MRDRAFDADRTLPCGTRVESLVTVLAGDGSAQLTEHTRTCPHCRSELSELRAAWAPVQQLAVLPVEPPEGLLDRALSTARGVREHGSAPAQVDQSGGTLRISASALLVLTRQLCSDVLRDFPGVHLRGCSGGADEVRIDLSVRYSSPAAEISRAVQHELNRLLWETLGGAAPAVWLRIVDVTSAGEPRTHRPK